MSFHRENIVWQSADGTWNRGFYAEDYLSCGGNEEECGDETHEWCREFDHTSFDWVSVGHPSKDAAHTSWDGANPGSAWVLPCDPDNDSCVAEVAELEDLAARRYEYATARAAQHSGSRTGLYGGSYRHPGGTAYWGYSGPPRQRTLAKIKAERDRLVESWASLRGRNATDEARLDTQIADRLRTATDEEREAYRVAEAAHLDRIRDLVANSRKSRQDRSRYRPWGGAPSSDAARIDLEREVLAYVEEREQTAAPAAHHHHEQQQAHDQQRQPKGAPASTGGQFASRARAESDVELGGSPTGWGADPWG